MRSVVVVLLFTAGCATNTLSLVWSGKPVVDFDAFSQPEPLAGPVDSTALSCWRARADVDHGGFFVMKMSRGTYALRFCVPTADVLKVKQTGMPMRIPVRI